MTKPVRIFTTVWGDKHFEWLEKFALPSLRWNKEALEGATWVVNTRGPERERAEQIINASGIRFMDLEFCLFGSEFDQNPHASGHFINQALLNEISRCITFNVPSLMAPPDTIWGPGTIGNLREVGDQRDVVVFVAHARVLPTIDGELQSVHSNAGLVSAAWKHLHATWVNAEYGLDKINSYVGGVFWRYLSENLYAVQHRLPTPYLINYTPEDLVYFKNQIHWGCIDHSWPSDCLIATERQRVIGSSDAAFMVEVTEENQNIPPNEHYRSNEPDLFWKNGIHNRHNRMFTVIFRGENV